MITPEICHQLFNYKDGNLYWKNRTISKGRKSVKNGKKVGTVGGNGYLDVNINKQRYRVHRLIFMMFNGYFPEEVDHINNNRADNRVENLRASDKTTNKHNSLKPKTNTSGIKGVSWVAKRNYWRCVLWNNNKSKEVSGFKTKELASEFMELWREMAHKEFANHG